MDIGAFGGARNAAAFERRSVTADLVIASMRIAQCCGAARPSGSGVGTTRNFSRVFRHESGNVCHSLSHAETGVVLRTDFAERAVAQHSRRTGLTELPCGLLVRSDLSRQRRCDAGAPEGALNPPSARQPTRPCRFASWPLECSSRDA
jgi:hypothetical protein